MQPRSPLTEASSAATWTEVGGVALPERFEPPAREYERVRAAGGLFDRSNRMLVRVSGSDRRDWLHNLVTNAVKTLDDHAGNYAFACDVRGRCLFDLNILARPDFLLLDFERAVAPAALQHLERHLIMEDARLEPLDGGAALGVAGPAAEPTAFSLGVENFAALPDLGSVELAEGIWLVRHAFAGLPGFELHGPTARVAAYWARIVEQGVRPAGQATLDVLRIEAGIPWVGRDIDDKVIPPETGQIERGISYHKGCYLGQEVIERMRSHGSQARRLARLELPGSAAPTLPAALRLDDKEVGRLTSSARHPLRDVCVGLGYLRTRLADPRGIETDGVPVSVVDDQASAGGA